MAIIDKNETFSSLIVRHGRMNPRLLSISIFMNYRDSSLVYSCYEALLTERFAYLIHALLKVWNKLLSKVFNILISYNKSTF